MKDRIILITGSTDGIGQETALKLSEKSAQIIIHGRNKEKCISTVYEIEQKSGKKSAYFTSDFSSLDEVRFLSEQIKNNYKKLDVLINNAGVYMHQKEISKDGYEMTFAVNYLAHFFLTNLLLGLLKKSPSARIINISSVSHFDADVDFENINAEKSFNAYKAYAFSKLANILFTYELAEKLKDDKITVNALHPGAIGTKLLREGFNMSGKSVELGAETPVYLASSWWIRNKTGKYFVNKKEEKSSSVSYDKNIQKIMWQISAEFSGLNDE